MFNANIPGCELLALNESKKEDGTHKGWRLKCLIRKDTNFQLISVIVEDDQRAEIQSLLGKTATLPCLIGAFATKDGNALNWFKLQGKPLFSDDPDMVVIEEEAA